jgi:hypothetical protein
MKVSSEKKKNLHENHALMHINLHFVSYKVHDYLLPPAFTLSQLLTTLSLAVAVDSCIPPSSPPQWCHSFVNWIQGTPDQSKNVFGHRKSSHHHHRQFQLTSSIPKKMI